MADEPQDNPQPEPRSSEVGGLYSKYVLSVLVLVYILNFLDRQILSILNEEIKADLGLTDAQMGFLFGTAFAVFYALFGLPLGRLADNWHRSRLIAIGLAVWSGMTAVSGLAKNFVHLAGARIGVGIGEASATPAAFSLLSDYFPKRQRATALAIYSSGIYLGAGLGLGVGGVIVDAWNQAYEGMAAPFGLAGWQVAFFAVGLPGLLIAAWVATLREPIRGQADGIYSEVDPHPFRAFFRELRSVLPPLTLLHLYLEGGRARVFTLNLSAAAALGLAAWGLAATLGSPAQWTALAIGLYATVTWAQSLLIRDRPTFGMVFQGNAIRLIGLGFATLAFTGYGMGYWTPPFFIRVHGMSAGEAGLILGGLAASGGFLGVTLGGYLADLWKRVSVNGRLWMGVMTAILPIPFAVGMLTVDSQVIALALSFPVSILTSMWLGPGASSIQDLVLPRMRGTASAAYLLTITFVGLAMGPYTIGLLSVKLGSLPLAMGLSLLANIAVVALCLLAMLVLRSDERTLLDRARRSGEAV